MEESAIGHELNLKTVLPKGEIVFLKTDRTIYALKGGKLFATCQ
jgi:hypothetical protein